MSGNSSGAAGASCKEPNLLQKYVSIPILKFLAKNTGLTIGTGVGGSGAVGPPGGGPSVSLCASQQLVVSPNGQAAIETSIAVGGGGGAGAIGGLQFSVSNARTPQDLAGPFGQVGAGAGYKLGGGADLAWVPDPNHPGQYTWQLTGTAGGGVGGFGAASGGSNTDIQPVCP
jgi:hypothetical protein